MQIWVFSGLTIMMWTVLFWTFKISITQLLKKLEALVSEVKNLTEEVVSHHHRIDIMEDRLKEQRIKGEKNGERIRKLEIVRKNG